jgi:allantoate deiminase
MARCDALAACSEEPGRITRPYGSAALKAAREIVTGWMREAGLDIRVDAVGNLRGRRTGSSTDKPALLLGSHLDSVRDAGRYDGPLGVLVALSAVERLQAEGQSLPFPVEVVAFADEEGLRFQSTYLGSRALTGSFDPKMLDLVDAKGIALRRAIVEFGGDPEAIPAAALGRDEAFAYVEVHIEQGPRLEAIDKPVGVVSAIAGQSRVAVAFRGQAGHAGTVSMALRHDPLPAAAELILAVERIARDTPNLVATVGQLEVLPGASNVIPGLARLTLDVRHPEDEVREHALSEMASIAHGVAASRSLELSWDVRSNQPATPCDDRLTASLAGAAAHGDTPVVRLHSGAGHDAVAMASVVPVAMLFVRCAGGISHHPAESVSPSDVTVAIEVLDRFLEALAVERRA